MEKTIMKKVPYLPLFLVLNFGALFIGSLLMNSGPTSSWYLSMNKAPWTPPGWVFGAAWTTIMVCFSYYMAQLIKTKPSLFVWKLFAVQWLLNVSWNYLFFNQHFIFLSLLVLIALTILVGFLMINQLYVLKIKSLSIVPYFLWLFIATSLNVYAFIYN